MKECCYNCKYSILVGKIGLQCGNIECSIEHAKKVLDFEKAKKERCDYYAPSERCTDNRHLLLNFHYK